MTETKSPLKGMSIGAIFGGLETLSLCATKGITGNIGDFFMHCKEFALNGVRGITNIPTNWYVTPEHFYLVMVGSIYGGLAGSKLKKISCNGKINGNDLNSKITIENIFSHTVIATLLGLTARYVARSLGAEYDPSITSLFYFSIPAGITGGAVETVNKLVENRYEEEQKFSKQAKE